MQTIILKHVQVFVVITFEIFQIGWVGSTVSKLFLDFWIFFIFTRSLRHVCQLSGLNGFPQNYVNTISSDKLGK